METGRSTSAMKRDVWGVFHDGYVVGVSGNIPGSVRLDISIEYLRRMFPGNGHGFQITLERCKKILYVPFEDPPTQDPVAIAQHELEILYVISEDPLRLDCAEGVLEIDYEDITIALDTGSPVTYDELVDQCNRYWNGFRDGARGAE